MRDQESPQTMQQTLVVPATDDPAASRRIFVVTDDHIFAGELKVQLSYFGYDVNVFYTLADFRHAIRSVLDVLVLMDLTFPEDKLAGVGIMKELQNGRESPLPVVFFSSDDTIVSRLEAVRAGSIAYLSKPVDVASLIDKLDNMSSARTHEPYRVMIVDDSVAVANYHATVLEQVGMKVKIVHNPLKAAEELPEFNPDLILIDIYMPECNGMELAKVIRQIDAFVSIPIVFLSTEKDLDTQLFAMNLGGDDFLTKPIQPEHLISSVNSRIRRSLMLRNFMIRDSLTGLLNHTAIKDQLDGEVARAKRQNKPLSFAMIDIDNFKRVNDNYGHPAGDRVIKSLARLLKQRLSANDLVGRYGGEEFAVILVDTEGAAALKVLDTIRNDFSQLRLVADEKEFSASFSCGIAEVTKSPDANGLCDAADKALYKAKHAGRNRVMLS